MEPNLLQRQFLTAEPNLKMFIKQFLLGCQVLLLLKANMSFKEYLIFCPKQDIMSPYINKE